MRRGAAIAFAATFLAACEDPGTVNQLNPADVFTPDALDFGERSLNVTHELHTSLVVREALRVSTVRFDQGGDVFAARTRSGTLRGTSLTPSVPLDVIVQFVPRTEADYDTSMVVVFATGQSVSLSIKGAGRIAASTAGLTITPSLVQFAETEIDRDVTVPIEVQNGSTELRTLQRVTDGAGVPVGAASSFYVTRANGTEAGVPLTLMAGAKERLDLHFHPRASGPESATLQFYAQGFDAAPTDTVSAQGTGIKAGDLTCDPIRVEFGGLVRGRSAEQSVVCNVTGGVYTVRRASLDDATSPRFTVLSAPAVGTVIQAGGQFVVRTQFSADGVATTHRGGLVLTSGLDRTQVIAIDGMVLRPPLEDIRVNVVLSWNTTTDMDLHLVKTGASPFDPLSDCFYQRRTQDWGRRGDGVDDPVLDRDAIGFGPEEISIQTPADGGYEIFVHYYRGQDVATDAQVTLRVLGVERAVQMHGMTRCGDLWHVGRVDAGGGNVAFTPAGEVTDARLLGDCP